MLTHYSSPKRKSLSQRAQAIVEFAIVLPILMMLLVGIFEAARMVFIFSAVNNASREAARYGSTVGLADGSVSYKYNHCAGIRDTARRSVFFMTLPDSNITITYDHGPGLLFDECPSGVVADPTIDVISGDRVTVTVAAPYSPLITLIPIRSRTFTSTSSRTILGIFELD